MKYKIMVVDDDPYIRSSLENVFNSRGYETILCENGKISLEKMEDELPDVVLLDIKLGDMNGIDVLKIIKSKYSQIPVVMITAYTDVKTVVSAMKLGAYDFIEKPLDLDRIEMVIKRVLEKVKISQENENLKKELKDKEEFSEIIFNSFKMNEILKIADEYAKGSDTTVLIEGESGTGKEVIARYIHTKSLRTNEQFIAINCGAIPKDLIESELFGYEKGAFTGAQYRTNKGKFEISNGGTILLDEIGELSAEAQVKLLRVLQEKKFFRIGGTKEISVDVRIIASTNKILEEELEKGNFREDLFYRLNVARVKIPPLRERKEDIMLLANLFIKEFNKKFNKSITHISKEAGDFLLNYQWRGNVRELRNAIERVVLLSQERIIRKEDFYFLSSEKRFEKQEIMDLINLPSEGISIDKILKELIIRTLSLTNGNQVKTSKILGISRGKLLYRMKKLNIKVPPKGDLS
jgi:DNA-binding NtrC family response regulator